MKHLLDNILYKPYFYSKIKKVESIMTTYCENCGEELTPEEEDEGICRNCKASKKNESKEENDEDYIDPGIA
jgi:uncharacterized OB-fold protein